MQIQAREVQAKTMKRGYTTMTRGADHNGVSTTISHRLNTLTKDTHFLTI